MEQYYALLVQINEYIRMNDEDRMYAAISELDDRLSRFQMEVVRDDDHSCYTIGITEYIQSDR